MMLTQKIANSLQPGKQRQIHPVVKSKPLLVRQFDETSVESDTTEKEFDDCPAQNSVAKTKVSDSDTQHTTGGKLHRYLVKSASPQMKESDSSNESCDLQASHVQPSLGSSKLQHLNQHKIPKIFQLQKPQSNFDKIQIHHRKAATTYINSKYINMVRQNTTRAQSKNKKQKASSFILCDEDNNTQQSLGLNLN